MKKWYFGPLAELATRVAKLPKLKDMAVAAAWALQYPGTDRFDEVASFGNVDEFLRIFHALLLWFISAS
jgi:hypothetical protein